MKLLLELILGHYLMDFGLQNDYIATTKVPGKPNWIHSMVAHCAMQAIPVFFLTGNGWLTVFEFVMHFVIDYSKCKGYIDFHIDQIFHILCKIAWVLLYTYVF